MTKKLTWRLSKLPTPDELRELVKDKIVTQEEAREILFNNEEIEDRDKKSLESEIKFLRELVEKLSKDRSQIVEIIREVKVPYYQWNWYKPYEVWCSSGGTAYQGIQCATNTTGTLQSGTSANCAFNSIQTF
jgi:phosphoserine phosphatase